MKRITILAAVVMSMCSCSGAAYDIEGSFGEDFPREELPSEVRLVDLYDTTDEIAAAQVAADGTFRFKGRAEVPQPALVKNDNGSTLALVFLEKGRITVSPASGRNLAAAGTPSNDAYAAYVGQMLDMQARVFIDRRFPQESYRSYTDEMNRLSEEVMARNTDNLCGVYMLESSMQGMTAERIKAAVERLSPQMRAHPIITRRVLPALEHLLRTEVGAPYTDLTLPDAEGVPASLGALVSAGKWVLIDFWAAWCKPCIDEIPFIKAAYARFAPCGFEVYAISLDNDAEAWRRVIAENDLAWVNVRGTDAAGESTAAKAYLVQSIPANFLISPEGRIVAKNLRGTALEEFLATVLVAKQE